MKIILCSPSTTVRERWYSILAGKNHSLYLAASLQMLNTLVHKNETYLLLTHKPFAAPERISMLCKNKLFRVLLLSDSPNAQEEITFLQYGAAGYANTYIAPNRLLEAVKTIEDGRAWFEYQIINSLIRAMSTGDKKSADDILSSMPEGLSEREKEIAFLVSRGYTNQAIAEKLYISERTVKAHLGTIFSKTGAQSRLQLALLVLNIKQ